MIFGCLFYLQLFENPHGCIDMKIENIMRHITLALSVLVLVTGCHTAPRVTEGSVEVASHDARLKLYFTDRERESIYTHYEKAKKHKKKHKNKHKQMPPGLAKKKHLPPGLQKQLVRNGTLPPGLQGRGLPMDLERHMHRLPDDYIRVIVGSDIVLMNKRTRVIFDVMLDAVLD